MGRQNRKPEIIASILEHLKSAVKGPKPITNRSLMKVANCGSATFYKYVTEGSKIRSEIDEARRRQIEKDVIDEPGRRRKESEKDAAREKKGNKELLEHLTQFIANLKICGVSEDLIQWAQSTPMSKPDRSVSHAGRSRRGRNPRKY